MYLTWLYIFFQTWIKLSGNWYNVIRIYSVINEIIMIIITIITIIIIIYTYMFL